MDCVKTLGFWIVLRRAVDRNFDDVIASGSANVHQEKNLPAADASRRYEVLFFLFSLEGGE